MKVQGKGDEMFEITETELRRGSFEKAYNEGYLLFLNDIFPKENIKRVEGKFNSIIYYCRFLEKNKQMNAFVEVTRDDKISTYYCSCNEVGHYVGGMCRHLLAFCFSIIKYYQNGNELSVSDETLQNIAEQKKIEEKNRKIRAMEYKKKVLIDENKKNFQILLEHYNSEEQDITLKDKVRLVPAIYSNNLIGFRVGIDKLYIVKNMKDFLEAVALEKEIQYGKKLAFKHKLENFDEPSQKLIKMFLISFRFSTILSNPREIKLTELLVDEIMELYKNKYIFIMNDKDGEYKECFVNPNPYKFNISLNEKGILKINNIGKDIQLLNGKKNKYLISNYAVYKIQEENQSLKPLIEHLLTKGDIDVMDVLDPFITYLYPIIYEYINVDDKFKTNYPLNILKIDSYFDINDGVINLEYKYYVDGIEVSEYELMNYRYNSFKLDNYFKTIKKLGLEEGCNDLGEVTYNIVDTNKVVEFLKKDLSILNDYGEVYYSEALKRTTVNKMTKGSVKIRYEVDLLSVVFDEFDYSNEELYKLLNAYKTKKKFVKLSKERIIEVDEEAMEQINEVVEELNLDSKHLITGNKVPLYQSFKTFEENDFFSYIVDNDIRAIVKDIKEYKTQNFELDKDIKQNLRSYQIEAFNWLKILAKYKFGGVLADDMGLGKTLEVISLLSSDEELKPSLIVCPKSLTFNWVNEITKWNKNLDCQVIYGITSDRNTIISDIELNKKKVYITSYDSLRNDIALYGDIHFRFVILDEGQFIKNNDAKKTKAVKSLDSEVRFVLTGTPIENSLSDLWSIFDFIMPNYLSSYKRFKDKYENGIVLENDKEMLNTLISKITPFVLRRTKEEVLKDLPEKFEITHYAFMQEEQKKVYESYLLKTRESLQQDTSKISILASLTRLRQLCVDPGMFLGNYTGRSAKIELCLDVVDEQIVSGHRMLIFSQFKSVFARLIDEFEKRNIKYFILTGDTSHEERISMVEEFNNNEEIKVFLISLKAGGTGLNLVGADTVIHLDPWWNVSAQNQATDRAHRIGQKKNVTVIKLICENTIEQKVIELQEKKKDLVEQVITQNDERIVKLDDDDLKYLLS